MGVTRGFGLLEGFLARRRAATADRLIPEAARSGRLLDVGCGTFPHFLVHTRFNERVGIDKMVRDDAQLPAGVVFRHHDIESDPDLPFEDRSFDVVTMLAVFEHLAPCALHHLLVDIRRVLRPGGALVLTTPAAWSDPILRTLARLRLVSPIEIDEHQGLYTHRIISQHLRRAGFPAHTLRHGYFELGLNLWATATAPESAGPAPPYASADRPGSDPRA